MIIYLKYVDNDIWDTVENCYTFPTYKVGNLDITKHRDEWDFVDKKYFSLHAEVRNTLISSVDENEYNCISYYLIVKEIWNTLVAN